MKKALAILLLAAFSYSAVSAQPVHHKRHRMHHRRHHHRRM